MTAPGEHVSARWAGWRAATDLHAYDARFAAMQAAGRHVHGEADLVTSFAPRGVLDAGCGTGRLAIELARRGVDVVGVDLDPDMIDAARGKAPLLAWVVDDLAALELGRSFDVAVMAGNVLLFCEPGTEPAIVAALARHLDDGGRLLAGYTVEPDRFTLGHYDRWCADAGLVLEHRWGTWDREPFTGGYAVSVHRVVSPTAPRGAR